MTANKLSTSDCAAAQAAAHKLAGTLGMFNLMRGTVVARELEQIYSRESAPDPTTAGLQLASMATMSWRQR